MLLLFVLSFFTAASVYACDHGSKIKLVPVVINLENFSLNNRWVPSAADNGVLASLNKKHNNCLAASCVLAPALGIYAGACVAWGFPLLATAVCLYGTVELTANIYAQNIRADATHHYQSSLFPLFVSRAQVQNYCDWCDVPRLDDHGNPISLSERLKLVDQRPWYHIKNFLVLRRAIKVPLFVDLKERVA
jgi:hypothetical protein